MVLYKTNLLESRLFAKLNSVFFFFFFNKEDFNNYFYFIFIFGNTGSPLLPVNFSLVVAGRGCYLIATHGLLIAVASLIAEHGLQGSWASVVAVCGL